MRFLYRGIDCDGHPVAGEAAAESAADATQQLEKESIQVTEMRPAPLRTPLSLGRGVSGADIAMFCEQLAHLTEADLPLHDALASLAHDTRKPALQAALLRLADGVAHGMDLDELLEENRAVFPPLLPALFRAGQASGRLSEVLRLAATHTWRMETLREQVIAAIAYPLLVLSLLLVIISSVFLYVVPQFRVMYMDLDIELPAMTLMIFFISQHFAGVFFSILGGMAFLTVFLYFFDDSIPCISLKRSLLFHVPLIGRVLRASYLARFCRFMNLLLDTGMPLDRAVDLLGELDDRSVSPRGARALAEALRRGSTLSDAMRMRLHMFPEILVWTVGACEEDNRLVEAFAEMAELYERETERQLQVVATVLPPACIIMIGGLIVMTVQGLFLPLISILEGLNG